MITKTLVTGGTGLVGNAIQDILVTEQHENEEWIFVGSKDADLTYKLYLLIIVNNCM